MKEKLLALLIAKFSGVRKDGLMQLARSLALQVATDEAATSLVDSLTDAQVNDFVKDWRSDVDKEVSDGNKTFETNLRKKYTFAEIKPEPEPGGGNGGNGGGAGDDIAAKLDALLDAKLKPLQDKLSKYEQGDVAKARLQSLNDKLTSCKDDDFKAQTLKSYARMAFDSDDAHNEYLADIETDITAANQKMADSALSGQGSPFFSNVGDNGVSQAVTDFIASQSPDKNDMSGKEV